MTERARIRSLVGGPALAPVFAAVRRRLERTGGAARSVTVRELAPEGRSALADLLGWSRVPAGAIRLDLAALDAALRQSAAAAELRAVVEALSGPLRDLRAEQGALRSARERLWDGVRSAVAAAGRPELEAWLGELRAGSLARAVRASGRPEEAVLVDALRAALRLPAGGKLLPVFASEALADPHALDAGAALTPLVLRAAAIVAGWAEVPGTAGGRRRLWAAAGVDCDPLSASVLVHGLRPDGVGLLARHLRESAGAGEPRVVTLRELARSALSFPAGTVLHVCENPAIVAAAADALGDHSAAIVCVEGVPSTAAVELLRRAVACGARLRVRADLDWAGLRIAAQVMALGSAEPWRFSAQAYEAAVREDRVGPALDGARGMSPWDPALAVAMDRAGVSVPEERMVDGLIEDLKNA